MEHGKSATFYAALCDGYDPKPAKPDKGTRMVIQDLVEDETGQSLSLLQFPNPISKRLKKEHMKSSADVHINDVSPISDAAESSDDESDAEHCSEPGSVGSDAPAQPGPTPNGSGDEEWVHPTRRLSEEFSPTSPRSPESHTGPCSGSDTIDKSDNQNSSETPSNSISSSSSSPPQGSTTARLCGNACAKKKGGHGKGKEADSFWAMGYSTSSPQAMLDANGLGNYLSQPQKYDGQARCPMQNGVYMPSRHRHERM